MKAKNKGQFISKTDIGLIRVVNEDRALTMVNASGDVLLCVCDGLGGHNKGDYAAQVAVDILKTSFKSRSKFLFGIGVRHFISKNLHEINANIFRKSSMNETYEGMGSTLVMCILHGKKCYFASVGDSRVYAMEKGKISQISEDQSYVDFLYKTGQIKKEEMASHHDRNKLLNALGTYPSISYSLKVKTNNFDGVILCSDGLYNNITDSEIENILKTRERIEQKVDTLIGVAKSNGGSDNIAITYWERIK